MALALKDLMKKAKDKGLEKNDIPSSPVESFYRPWQQESVLFINRSDNKLGNTLENVLGNKIDNESGNKLEIELGNNQGTIREQEANTSGTIREQSGNNQGTIREHIRKQIGNNIGNILDNELENRILEYNLIRLCGIQRDLFNYAFDLCLARDDNTTGYILTQQMSETLKCSYESAKISLKRIIKKGLINRMKGKTSRGGFLILEIPKEVKFLALNMRKEKYLGNNQENKSGNRMDNISSYNNSNNKIIIIGEGWDEIDFSSLSHLGFEKTTLLQFKNCSTPEIVQISIHYFAFEYEHENGKYKLSALISQLKKGKAWQRHPDYKTPQELTLERLRKEAQEAQRRAQQDVNELFELKFNEWFNDLNELDRKQKTISDHQEYFRQSKWQEIKKAWS